MLRVPRNDKEGDSVRRRIIVTLVVAIAAISALISLNPWGLIQSFFSTSITAGIAVSFSIIVIARQRASGLFGRTHLALAIGLAFWFAGQVIWAAEMTTSGREPSDLSAADIPWLALYVPFGYYILMTYRHFGKTVTKYHLVIVAGIVAVLTFSAVYTAYFFYKHSMVQGGNSGEQPSMLVATIRSAYPLGDAVLVVPAILLLITLRKGMLTYTPWLFVASALILVSVADMLFTNMALLNRTDLSGYAYTLYNAGNLAFAGGLYWYNRFVIFNAKWVIEEFQRANR